MTDTVVHVGDVGTVFEVTVLEDGVPLDVSTATDKALLFRSPSGALAVQAAAFTTTGADGKIEYQTLSGDIDEVGTWRVQGRIVIPQGTFYTDVGYFTAKTTLA